MKITDLFIGRLIYWLIAAVVVTGLGALGMMQFHVRSFVPFHFIVLALAIFVVLAILAVYSPDERATRDQLDPQDLE